MYFITELPFHRLMTTGPGRVFYASTHAGETNTWWPHVRYFNEYMRRIQAPMQEARFDADVALYFPVHDSWRFSFGHGVKFDSVGKSVPTGSAELLQLCEVNRSEHWFREPAPVTFETAVFLQEHGWQYDYISDSVITGSAGPEDSLLTVNSMKYKALVFAGCHEAGRPTLEKLETLMENGVKIIFIKGFPFPVDREAACADKRSPANNPFQERYSRFSGKTCFVIDSVDELPALLNSLNIKNESIPGVGPEIYPAQRPRRNRISH